MATPTLTPKTQPIVIVNWEDIVFDDNWNGEEENPQPVEISTVGWLLYENSTMIVVASTYNWREEQWGTVHAFPKSEPDVSIICEGVEHGLRN
jgi:hypothetical protein